MKLPTQQEALESFARYKVPQNIFKHCLKVREVAEFLAKELNSSGAKIDVELVSSLALLHDLFKAVVLPELKANSLHPEEFSNEEIAMWKKLKEKHPGMHETEIAYEAFKEEFPQFALLLRDVSNPFKRDRIPEQKLVHYADWRTFREEVVDLARRLEYIKQAYPHREAYWTPDYAQIREVEKEIFSQLPFASSELKERFENDQ